MRKSAKKVADQADKHQLFDEILVLKHELIEMQQERKVLQSKLRYMEVEIMKKDRKYEDLLSTNVLSLWMILWRI